MLFFLSFLDTFAFEKMLIFIIYKNFYNIAKSLQPKFAHISLNAEKRCFKKATGK